MRSTSPTSSGSAPRSCAAFSHDFVLVGLVIYAFSLADHRHAPGAVSRKLHDASIGIVDEDHSDLSRRIAHAFLPPYFKTPQPICRARHRAR